MKKNISPFSLWLSVCFAFIAIMITARILYSGSTNYLFLVWNLFLAWVPYAVSIVLSSNTFRQKWKQVVLFFTWLLFFPNALYIVTDIIHVQESTLVPIWYDAILLFAAFFAGLALAFASIIQVECFLLQYFTLKKMPFIIFSLLFIGSFGVYLGRFQRWNSWDVLHNPLALFSDIALRFTNPIAHTKTWTITFLLSGLYTICWYFIKVISPIRLQKVDTK